MLDLENSVKYKLIRRKFYCQLITSRKPNFPGSVIAEYLFSILMIFLTLKTKLEKETL